MRRSVVADTAVLEVHGCSVEHVPIATSQVAIEAHNTDHFVEVLNHPSGWKFQSFHRHILNEKERKIVAGCYRSTLKSMFPSLVTLPDNDDDDDLQIDDYKLHLPPMFFGRDIMSFVCPHAGQLSINAGDAIFCWLSQHVPEIAADHPLNVVKVPHAKKWATRLQQHHITPIHPHTHNSPAITVSTGVDTAITTPSTNNDAVLSSQSSSASTSLFASAASTSTANAPPTSLPALTAIKASDWTFSTDYCCTLLDTVVATGTNDLEHFPRHILHGKPYGGQVSFDTAATSEHRTPSRWEVKHQEQSGIDYEMLKRRDLPILFYDEVTLYEDDLEDCGEVCVEAKLRVMPDCWFALVKYFLRIDQVLVRCRETRLFHSFNETLASDAPVDIHMEVVWKELQLIDDSTTAADAAAALALSTSLPATTATVAASRLSGLVPSPQSATIPSTAFVPGAATQRPYPSALLGGYGARPSPASIPAAMSAVLPPGAMSSTALPGPPPMMHHNSNPHHQRYTKDKTADLPTVNDSQGIPQFSTLSLRR